MNTPEQTTAYQQLRELVKDEEISSKLDPSVCALFGLFAAARRDVDNCSAPLTVRLKQGGSLDLSQYAHVFMEKESLISLAANPRQVIELLNTSDVEYLKELKSMDGSDAEINSEAVPPPGQLRPWD